MYTTGEERGKNAGCLRKTMNAFGVRLTQVDVGRHLKMNAFGLHSSQLDLGRQWTTNAVGCHMAEKARFFHKSTNGVRRWERTQGQILRVTAGRSCRVVTRGKPETNRMTLGDDSLFDSCFPCLSACLKHDTLPSATPDSNILTIIM